MLSGSDDSNLRIWKARAAEKLGTVDKREMARKEYRDGLRDKWGGVGEVAKLERYVPPLPLPTTFFRTILMMDAQLVNDSSLNRFIMPKLYVARYSKRDPKRRRIESLMRPREWIEPNYVLKRNESALSCA